MGKSGNLSRGLVAFMMVMTLLFACAAMAEDGLCKVYFNYNYQGAPEAAAVLVESGSTVDQPAAPTREDHVFTGWYANSICTQAYDFSAPVNGTLRLFAGWMPTRVTVTCYLQADGLADVTRNVPVGECLAPIDDPVNEGYEFTGWYANAAGTKPFDFDQPVPAHDLTLYAGWAQQRAKITYVLHDDVTIEVQAEFGQPLTVPDIPEREDHVFADWYASAAGADKYDFSAPVTGNTRIYARWTQTVATVTFDGNHEGAAVSHGKVDIGAAVKAPREKPEREGYDFTDWYSDAACTQAFDFDTPITGDTTLYAGWTAMEYTVKFYANYEGGENIVTKVQHGQQAVLPDDPVRDGYSFTGWYTDKNGTELFDAAQRITRRTTAYAGWQSAREAGDERIIRFMYNYGDLGEYASETYTSVRRIKAPEAPVRPGYFFAGWAKDPEGTTLFNFTAERSTASMTLFAKWLKGYTFEAEYTFLDGKPGQGSSDNCMGADLIQTPKDVLGNGEQMGMSNNAYVGKLYYNGAYLDFQITSAEEVADAVLVLRLTPDLFDMRFTDETWQVIVNDERIGYGRLNLTGAIAQTDFDALGNTVNGDMNKRPFQNYVITTALYLQKGENTIRLMTNNREDHGGTFNAETPLIDCLYIYSNAEVSWTVCYPENMGKTLADVDYTVTYDTAAE